ncbi:MAG: DNA polymerase III subunit gamma/tau [Muribaculaceae bacterium]|nr:DNA polymerase III subunit gamma/tau [Muribaculaceae bacterium]
MYIVSARKYRPSTFASVVGQRALTSTLKNAIATGRLAHSYLFCGSRGVGKTSCARIFAKTINCQNPTPDGEACNQCDSCRSFNDGNSMNIIELDAASNNGVDDIRQLVDQVQTPPSNGRYRVFIVDEVHMLSAAAFNAFLKTLEEPPSYVIFILATTEKHKIIPTILSRCQIYDFNRITVADMVEHLQYVASQEGITAEPAALSVIARKADGAMRDALSIFDQVAASSRGQITYQSTIDNLNVLDSNYYNRLLECFLAGRTLESWLIYKEIRDRGFDSHFFITGLGDYMRDLMVAMSPTTITLLEADDEVKAKMAAMAAKCSPEFIYRAMNLCNEADINWRTVSNKQFLVELTLAKICQLSSPSPVESGSGEGQLQKIAASPVSQRQEAPQQPSAPAQTSPQKPAAPQPQPAAAVKPQVIPQAQQQSRKNVRTMTRPGARGFSLHDESGKGDSPQGSDASSSVSPAPTATIQRKASFTREQLNSAWQAFINANPTHHILANTMRASFPAHVEGFTYKVMIENLKQREELERAMSYILDHLRRTLGNDLISIEIELNQGESSPHTWNERQVLDHMTEGNPVLRDLIADFGLTIG